MHPRICVSGVSTWNWTIAEELALCQTAGIHTIGASLRKMEAEGVAESVRRFADSGVKVANLIGLGPLEVQHPERWPAQRDRLRQVIETAVTLGAGCMVLTTGPGYPLSWEEAADRACEALAPIATECRAAGVDFAMEHTNGLRVDVSFVHTLRDMVDLARRIGTGVCAETNACWAERGLAETITAGVDTFQLVQVSDFAAGTNSTPNRAVIGDGIIPFERILGQILAAGYTGFFDLELIGPRIEAEGYESAIRRSVDALTELLTHLGAT